MTSHLRSCARGRASSKAFGLLLGPLLSLLTLLALPLAAHAERGHGPQAPANQFPSHLFRRAPRAPKAQLAFHYGLVQPVLLHGFNAAVDLRIGRFILSYSHGQGLEVDRSPGLLTATEKKAHMSLFQPWTTGGGMGFTILDELYVMADLKVHRFEAELDDNHAGYTTLTVGVELGYRFFLWKGFYLSPVARYWPNVWNSAGGKLHIQDQQGNAIAHTPVGQGVQGSGLFVNLLVGWAFDLE